MDQSGNAKGINEGKGRREEGRKGGRLVRQAASGLVYNHKG